MSENEQTPTPPNAIDLPASTQADLADPPTVRRRWYWTIGPAYAGVFVWVPFFDQLGRDTLPFVSWPILIGAGLVASLLCEFLLYRPPALWGYRTGSRMSVVLSATFGTRGSTWITGPILGIAAVVWHAVALTYALDLIFRALLDFGFILPESLEPRRIGPISIRPPVVLLTAFWWIFIIRIAGKSFAHVIATLMKVYTPTALVLLALTMIISITGVSPDRTGGSGDLSAFQGAEGTRAILPALQLIHLIFGYFAMAGLMAAEWGRTVPDERDVRLGGSVGVGLTCFLTMALSILTVAGSLGMRPNDSTNIPLRWIDPEAPPFTFIRAVERTIGGPIAGVILALFGIATLAPACYSTSLYTHRFYRQWPFASRKRWAWIGSIVSFLVVACHGIERTAPVFSITGAVFAPAVGCLAADFRRQRGHWHGVRRGYNPAGIVAWFIGLAVGLIPLLGDWLSLPMAEQFQPASLFAFVAAFLAYHLLAASGFESPTLELPRPEP